MKHHKNVKIISVLLVIIVCVGTGVYFGTDLFSNQTMVYGKVTAIDGSKITLALGTVKQHNQNQALPDGERDDSLEKGSPPISGNDNRQKQMPPSGDSKGGPSGPLTLTGKSKTIILSNPSIIRKESRRASGMIPQDADSGITTTLITTGSAASISDIKTGVLLRITYQKGTDKIKSIVIMGGADRSDKKNDISNETTVGNTTADT